MSSHWLRAGSSIMLLGLAAPARADVVAVWYEKAAAAGYKAEASTPVNTRHVTIVALAMFDAANAIAPRYTAYRPQPATRPGASTEAAVAAAAHYLLIRFYPDQTDGLDAAYRASLEPIPEGTARTDGIAAGERAAASLLEERNGDGSEAPNVYRPFTTAGTYVPTVFPIAPGWGSMKPFALKSGGQFRPAAPYALTSPQWATDYNEVKRMGARKGSARTAEQTEIARFWELTGPGTYSPVVRQLAEAKQLALLEHARLMALVSLAAADAMIAVLDAKYTYNFWRPVTAIRNGDLDSNDATERDPAWEPFITTPMHPEYPCAHCITQSAVATVLTAIFEDTVPTFALTSPTAAGVTRRFNRLSDYVAEVVNARVYDGVHYRTSGEVGAAMGREIGGYVVEHWLKPVR